jgi:hypothetical protein
MVESRAIKDLFPQDPSQYRRSLEVRWKRRQRMRDKMKLLARTDKGEALSKEMSQATDPQELSDLAIRVAKATAAVRKKDVKQPPHEQPQRMLSLGEREELLEEISQATDPQQLSDLTIRLVNAAVLPSTTEGEGDVHPRSALLHQVDLFSTRPRGQELLQGLPTEPTQENTSTALVTVIKEAANRKNQQKKIPNRPLTYQRHTES